jgi:phage tail-like protein
MSQTLAPLKVQITPMQVSEAMIQPIALIPESSALTVKSPVTEGLETLARKRDREIILYPGERSELLLQIENPTSYLLYFNLEVEGDFPLEWHQIELDRYYLSTSLFKLWRMVMLSQNLAQDDSIIVFLLQFLTIFVPSHSQVDLAIYFQIDQDFFEKNQFWSSASFPKIDYQGKLKIRYAYQSTEQIFPVNLPDLIQRDFQLYIRPRSLYLNFLPELYRDVDFIGRFLKIFEETFEPAVEILDHLWAYLNPLTSPESLLPFLAHWVGWKEIEDLPVNFSLTKEKQRELIHRAIQLYAWRGTKKGLRLYLHYYTDLPLDENLPEDRKHIYIQEVFEQGFIIGSAKLGDHPVIGSQQPYHFVVNLRFDQILTSEQKQIYEDLCHKIIEQEKPAFCTYKLYIN